MKSSVATNKTSAAIPSRGATSADQNSSTSSYPAIAVQEKSTTSLPAKLYRGLTSPIRLLPDFLIIGTQRGGTTSLYHYLQTHPCIAPATIKEVHFFDRRFHKGLAWYRGHFPTWIEKYYAQRFRCRTFLTGEASPSYLFHPHAPGRIAKVLPHVKLIVLLRNPVDRAYSQYYHVVEHGYGTLSFEEAVRDEEERIAKERARVLEDGRYDSYAFRHLSYLSRGIYIDQLQVWMSLFPREQFLILKSEDFYADPATACKQVLTFLNTPEAERQMEKKEFKQHNKNTYAKMDAGLRSRLVEYFKPHNARLYDYLGVDFGWDK